MESIFRNSYFIEKKTIVQTTSVSFVMCLQCLTGEKNHNISFGLERTLSTGNFDIKRFRMHRKGMTQVSLTLSVYIYVYVIVSSLLRATIC